MIDCTRKEVRLDLLEAHVSQFSQKLLECRTVNEVFFQMQAMCFAEVFQEAMSEASISGGASKQAIWDTVRAAFSQCSDKWGSLRHSLNKPYGYAGDFEILEYLYDQNTHHLTHPEYACFDEYVYQLNLICAVRQRKDIIALLLRSCHQQGLRSFCSIGSGGAREVFDEKDNLAGSEILLIDLDDRSFEFAKSRLADSDIEISTAQLDARKLSFEREFDVIYSFGLFDYLKDKAVDRILTAAKGSLSPGGYLIYSIKDTNHYHPWLYDVFCDWRFISRETVAADDVATRNGLKVVQCIPTENGAARVYVCQVA